jgi:hypothetical protein
MSKAYTVLWSVVFVGIAMLIHGCIRVLVDATVVLGRSMGRIP